MIRDVDFGWGILGRLYRGGTFLLQQQDLGNGRWAITELSLHFTGRLLLFKSLSINSVSQATDFRRMPSNLTLQEGLRLLLAGDQMTTSAKGVRKSERGRTSGGHLSNGESWLGICPSRDEIEARTAGPPLSSSRSHTLIAKIQD